MKNETLPVPVIQDKLIAAGLARAKDFGYDFATAETLVTDEVYGMFFEKLLMEAKGDCVKGSPVDRAVDGLLGQIAKAREMETENSH
jgi:hypothetical protein